MGPVTCNSKEMTHYNKTIKLHVVSKTNTCKVADLKFDDFGRRYEDFVHQGSCTLQYK